MKYTFFSLVDGRSLGSIDTSSEEALKRNTPPNACAVEGAYTHECFFINGRVQPIPPRPDAYSTWDFATRQWLDLRTEAERAADAAEEVATARRDAYPPLADLADAIYWQSQGDHSKMERYNAAVEAVKLQFPKLDAPPI